MTPSASPAEIAAAALQVSPSDVVAVEEIKHGLTNRSWRVRTSADVVVVRVSTADETALRIDRESEARILSLVAAENIGAPVLLCDPAHHALVTRYLGPPWALEDARSEANIRRAGHLLRRLHGLTPPPDVRKVDLAATVEGYLTTLDERGAGGELSAEALRERARKAGEVLRRDSVARLCHNDVHHLNVVDGGALHLIDWEYAGLGEAAFDLASVCVYHRYDSMRRDALLSAYTPSGAALRPRLDSALWLFEYIRDLWMAVRESA